nr:PREDICTED: COP9 signalosome complex subunit 7a [Struthio camelus australis]
MTGGLSGRSFLICKFLKAVRACGRKSYHAVTLFLNSSVSDYYRATLGIIRYKSYVPVRSNQERGLRKALLSCEVPVVACQGKALLGTLVSRRLRKGLWCRCFCGSAGREKLGLVKSNTLLFSLRIAEAANPPPLTEAQKNKLRHLSVVTLAAKIKCIPYSVLLEQLQLKNVRQLEDLVIEAVYADVLRGSLDQRNQRLEVDYSIGRDIRREELSTITRTLQEWCQGCEVVLSGIEEQVSRANQHKEQQLALKQQIESEVANLKKTIKKTTAAAAAATSQDPEQHLTELREPAPGTNQRQASKKTSKAKGLRGSAKIWSKSN